MADTVSPARLNDAATIAARHLKEGRISAARSIYADLLKKNPRDHDAIRGEAAIALQTGDTPRAIELFGILATSTPADPAAQLNLGVAYKMAQRVDEAGICFRRAVELDPSSADAHANLAAFMADKNDLDAAFGELAIAIEMNPDSADLRFNLANLHFQQQRMDLAERCYRDTLDLDDDHVGAWNNLALVLRTTDRRDEAIGCIEAALLRQPNDPALLVSLADHLLQAGRFEEAEGPAGQAVTLAPQDGMTRCTLAMIRMNLGRIDEATKGLVEAIRLSPEQPDIPHNLAIVLRRRGRLDAALTAAGRAVGLTKHPVDSPHLLHAELLHELGRHEEGWTAMDPVREASLVMDWPAAPLDFGALRHRNARFVAMDAAQAVFGSRFLGAVAPHFDHIEIVCPPLLRRLFESLDVVSEVKPADAIDRRALLDFDGLALPLEDLPRLLRATPAVSMDGARFALEPRRFPDGADADKFQRPHIGVWCEGDTTAQDFLAPLTDISDATIFSLQTGSYRQDLRQSLDAAVDIGRDLDDFRDLAEAMLAMDLIITPEGVVAHIAGALGVPLIVLASVTASWHWPRGQDTCPWYANARILRQSPDGTWRTAIDALIAALPSVALRRMDNDNHQPLSSESAP